jgi:rod shape-determining protein MreD
MKWVSFGILAGVTIVLQTAATRYVEIQSIRPDLMLILAVHYALWGPWPEAALAAWILGLVVDLQSLDRIGLHAFSFGLAAWAIVRIRQIVFRDHAATQIVITLLFTILIQIGVALYRRWGVDNPIGGSILWPALLTGLYTAMCAPYLHWLLIRMGRWTGLKASRGLLSPQ